MNNKYQDKEFKNIVWNQLSREKYHELKDEGLLNDDEFYITNDSFKEHAGGLDILDIGQSLYIDETQGLRRWLNGQTIPFKGNELFLERLEKAILRYPDLRCNTKEEFENAIKVEPFRQCGKFFIDYANKTIRLPKINYIEGPLKLDTLGVISNKRVLVKTYNNGANWYKLYSDGWCEQGGLETHATGTSNVGGITITFNRPFTDTNYTFTRLANNNNATNGTAVYALAYNTKSVDKITVGRESYSTQSNWKAEGFTAVPTADEIGLDDSKTSYYIQVATGLETVIDIEHHVTYNSPYFLGDSRYMKVAPRNLSWKLADDTFLKRQEYPSYYDLLLRVLNGKEEVEGMSVKALGDATIDRLDFVVDTKTETFKLPTLNGTEDMMNSTKDVIYYDKESFVPSSQYTAPYNGWFMFEKENQADKYVNLYNENTRIGHYQSMASSNCAWIQATLYANKGDIVGFYTSSTGTLNRLEFIIATKPGKLYWYMGETVQTSKVINLAK